MADTLDGAGFWLPPDFLTDHDLLMDKENFAKNGLNTDLSWNPFFPSEFPYDLGYAGSFGSSSVRTSPVESVVSSPETLSDEEDLFTVLTRQLARSTLRDVREITSRTQNLEKSWVLSGSPQSTLSGLGCWSSNGSPDGPSKGSSPPTTPLGANNDAWDLIFQAAGQVSRLKMNSDGSTKGRGLLNPPSSLTLVHPSPLVKPPNSGLFNNQCLYHALAQANHQVSQDQLLKLQGSAVLGRGPKEEWFSQNQLSQNRGSRIGFGGGGFVQSGRCGKPLGSVQSPWPPSQFQHQIQPLQNSGSGMKTVFFGGSGGGGSGGGGKRVCAGTGVFLPRRYGNPSETPRKKPAGVVQALNKNFDDMTVHTQHHQSHPRFNSASIPDYDLLMARRTAVVEPQRRSIRLEGAMNHEIRLPQEWTY
ncbi:unnamed protein product [Ilex paraguariensis]|uniref:Uncharacterized protein n=1 Tax=Ilex paraguariensis TaxID=185542 RepID=A0ABC8QT60_9AQUA